MSTFHITGEVKIVVGFGVAGILMDTWNVLVKAVGFSVSTPRLGVVV
jgi:hypothetical protein